MVENFQDMSLQGANFSNRELEGSFFDGSDLSRADFTGADLYGAYLYSACADKANFSKSSLRGAVFDCASLRDALFVGADLSHDNMGGTTSFQNTDLRGADLSEAIIIGTNFTGSIYNTKTKFPQGFYPHQEEMIELE